MMITLMKVMMITIVMKNRDSDSISIWPNVTTIG
jgi:hypothetical protein